MGKTYQITEYGSFVRDREVQGCIPLPQGTFDALESFILTNSSRDTDALELMGLSARKGIGKSIRNDKINALYTQCSDEEKAAACVLLNKNEEAISILNSIIQKDKETRIWDNSE